ncbi:outer membrane lipoprotein-sorting protein [Deferrisoma camini]|uniref:outer membrane lipoprotein-sorting protein n=1 Tax=Deferrisoma camini TaxID=1035120 RepID=UPI00046D8D61|nr:outer membrane lipoprotein-sorting protein [Deferrisoma camini]
MNRRPAVWAAAAALVFAAAAAGAALSPRQVLERADRARGKLPGMVWTVKMTSVERGRTRKQTLEVKARNEDVLATFTAPPRVKGQKLLMVGRNMWFIKPGVSKPVPISPRQKLMGQAANGDIASTNYSGDYDGVIVGEEAVNGEDCYVLDLRARNKKVTYDRIKYWVSKSRLVGVRAEFYTVSGKLFKTAEFEYRNRVRYRGEEIPFVSRMVIRDAIRPQEVTTLEYSKITVKRLPDATFNLNLLVR